MPSELSPGDADCAWDVKGVIVDAAYAEAFGMSATGIIITADTMKWARLAATIMTGFGTSVIACGAECGIDYEVQPQDTPDGRPGVRVLLFGFSRKALEPQLKKRVGQCVLTSPGSACFNGLESETHMAFSNGPRFFGDGWQASRALGDQRFWRIPVMDGEFVMEDTVGLTKQAVGGGNLLVLGTDRAGLLETCEHIVAAIDTVPDCITPFPGGIARSGSKVGSKYSGVRASTNNAYCPTLRGTTNSELDPHTAAAFEIVIDGLTSKRVGEAMAVGLRTGIEAGPKRGVYRISAGNYGGNLGQHHFHLHELLPDDLKQLATPCAPGQAGVQA